MPDWEKLVSDRLAQLALEERERQEVIAELAGHLEEIYEGSRGKGASHDEAIRRALQQVDDWKKLRQEIYVARTKENPMNARTSRLWVPSFVTLAASVITLVAFGRLGLQPGPLGSRPHHEEWSSHLIGGITGGPHAVNECGKRIHGLADGASVDWGARGTAFQTRWRNTSRDHYFRRFSGAGFVDHSSHHSLVRCVSWAWPT